MALNGRNLLANMFTSSRSSLTCTYKCGNACFGECENTSDNPYFGDQFSRRTALRAGGLAVVAVGGSSALAACAAPDEKDAAAGGGSSDKTSEVKGSDIELTSAEGMHFEAVEANTKDEVVIPKGYEQSVLIAWGDPVIEGAPEFDVNNQTAADAEKQFGFNNDFAGLIEHPDDKNRMIYMCSHEYTT